MFTKPKTVDSLLGQFSTLIDDLNRVELAKRNEADELYNKADDILLQARSANDEANRASGIAAKLSSLFSF